MSEKEFLAFLRRLTLDEKLRVLSFMDAMADLEILIQEKGVENVFKGSCSPCSYEQELN